MWDHAKLDALLELIESSFWEELKAEEGMPEDEQHHQQTGFFMYALLDCKPGGTLKGQPPASISGPLFDGQS